MIRNLKGKVSKNNFVSLTQDETSKPERANGFRKSFKKKLNFNMANVVPKETKPTQEVKIKRANLTGLPDEEIFGPAWLYEVPEMFEKKKSTYWSMGETVTIGDSQLFN